MGESVYQSLDEELKQYVNEKVELEKSYWIKGHYDFCIINSEDDQEDVNQFRDDFARKYNLVGVLECDPQMCKVGDYFDRIEEMVKRSTFVFLYITKHFGKDGMCLRHRSDLLTRFIDDKSLNLIPIFTKIEYSTLTPGGLRGVTGFKMFVKNEDSFRIKSTFSEEARRRRTQRDRIELNEFKFQEYLLREKYARELLERRESQQSNSSTTSTQMASNSTYNQISVDSANHMQIGNVYNINVLSLDDASRMLESLNVSDNPDEENEKTI